MKTLKFTVSQRADFNGYWILGRHFAPGIYEVEVDEQQEAEVRSNPGVVSVHGDAAKKAEEAQAKSDDKKPLNVKTIESFAGPDGLPGQAQDVVATEDDANKVAPKSFDNKKK